MSKSKSQYYTKLANEDWEYIHTSLAWQCKISFQGQTDMYRTFTCDMGDYSLALTINI